MTRRLEKHRLLFDEGCPPCNQLPRLNSRHNLKHILTDYKRLLRKRKRPLTDIEIYKIACVGKRLIVVFNRRHFRKLAQQSTKSGIIGISQNMGFEDIDKKLLALLSQKTRRELYGHYNSITNQTKIVRTAK